MALRKIEEFAFELSEQHIIELKARDPVPLDIDEPVKELINNMVHRRKDIFASIRQGSIEMVLHKREKYHIFAYEIKLNCGETWIIHGTSTSKQAAKNDAASRAIYILRNKFDFIQMPRNLIGLPNLRGHCYFIPVILPLFHNKSFVMAMEKGLQTAKKDKKKFQLYYVLRQLFENYRRASANPNFKVVNHPVGLKFKDSEIQKPWLENQSGLKLDLDMDSCLIKVCIKLKKIDPDYENPSGLPVKTYQDIMNKLEMEFGQANPFHSSLWCSFEFKVKCAVCNSEKLLVYDKPFITLRKSMKTFEIAKIQHVFAKPQSLLNVLKMKCCDSLDGTNCTSKKFTIKDYKIARTPDILTFIIPGDVTNDLPNPLNLEFTANFKFEDKKYEKFAYGVGFFVWADSKGNKYPARHRMAKKGDEVVGAHAILMIKYKKAWKEVNNDEVFLPKYKYNYGRDQMIVFYEAVV